MNPRKLVTIGFDGVLHELEGESGPPHKVDGRPVPGSMEWLFEVSLQFDLQIWSARHRTWRGRRSVRKWLERHMLDAWWRLGDPRKQYVLPEISLPKHRPDDRFVLEEVRVPRATPPTFPRIETLTRRSWSRPDEG